MSAHFDQIVELKSYAQMSHQILAFIAREFTKKTKQPMRSQELRRTELIFMLFVCHDRQQSERMHPIKAATIKRASSVDSVMRCTSGGERAAGVHYLYNPP
jgi:hypothetical protein